MRKHAELGNGRRELFQNGGRRVAAFGIQGHDLPVGEAVSQTTEHAVMLQDDFFNSALFVVSGQYYREDHSGTSPTARVERGRIAGKLRIAAATWRGASGSISGYMGSERTRAAACSATGKSPRLYPRSACAPVRCTG